MIPLFKVSMSRDVLSPLIETLTSGWIGQHEKVNDFEELLRNHFQVPYVNTTNSCTSALTLALRATEGHCDILTTPLTCFATNVPILTSGNYIRLRWVDVDPGTGNMDLNDLERKLNSNSTAVVVVHWGGYPVDVDRLKGIQQRYYEKYDCCFHVIEDCAHAWGSRYKNKLVGTLGNLSCFSFQAIKHFTTVDGGCLVCPDKESYEKTRLLRWYGMSRDDPFGDFRCQNDVLYPGYKFHMNDVNATIGLNNYKNSLVVVEQHKENGRYYDMHLQHVPGVTLMKREEGFDSSFWIYTIRVKDRDGFVKKMKECGIETSKVHERNDKYSCVKKFTEHLPNLDVLSQDMICIPVGWWVTPEDRDYIVTTIKNGW